MSTSAVQKSPVLKRKIQKKKKPISWESFQKRYLGREDGYKYEWLNGTIEKTKYTMDKTQAFIQRNLLAYFRTLLLAGKVHGELLSELDLFFKENHRRPDMCWLTDEQTDRLADNEYEVPAFVIEVLSSNDAVKKLEDKMNDYRAAGVKVVWQILPEHEAVHVYTGRNLENMTVCKGNKICSAKPALPGFSMSVKDIFKRASSSKTKS